MLASDYFIATIGFALLLVCMQCKHKTFTINIVLLNFETDLEFMNKDLFSEQNRIQIQIRFIYFYFKRKITSNEC